MTSYDTEIRCRLYTLLDRYEELDGLFTWEFMDRIAEEFKWSKWERLDMGIDDALEEYAEDNIDKWIRQLKGVKRCKVKVVLEVELDATTGCNMPMVEELVKSNLIYGIDPASEYENASVKILNVVGKEVDE